MNIILTGGSRGIGFETARLMARDNSNNLLIISRNETGLNKLKSLCDSEIPGHHLQTLSFDIVSGDYEKLLIETVLKSFKKTDILINNAGQLINKSFRDLTIKDFDLQFETNVKAPFRLIQLLLPYFNRPAHILNIASMGGFQGSVKFPGLSLYSASKGALAILTECLAEEFRKDGISVNCLALGSAHTKMFEEAFPGFQAPLNAGEMATWIANFALNGNKYFNGKILPVSVTTP